MLDERAEARLAARSAGRIYGERQVHKRNAAVSKCVGEKLIDARQTFDHFCDCRLQTSGTPIVSVAGAVAAHLDKSKKRRRVHKRRIEAQKVGMLFA